MAATLSLKRASTAAAATAAAASRGAAGNEILLRSLYRSLLRQGRLFDRVPAMKAVIPFPLPFSYQVLLGGHNRDFYAHNASVAEAVRRGFIDSRHAQTDLSDQVRIDLALQLQVQISKWQHLLLSQGGVQALPHGSHRETPSSSPASSSPPSGAPLLSYEDRYDKERQTDTELDRALAVLEEAQAKLAKGGEGEEGGMVNREEIKRLYEESLAIKPTADAHTYLGYMLSYEGAFKDAIMHCQLAIELDPSFGNAFNDLGLYLLHQDQPREALECFEQSKNKPRYEARYKPFLNCGHLLLELGQPHRAILEYLHALHHAGPERGKEIRAVVSDMARVLTSPAPTAADE